MRINLVGLPWHIAVLAIPFLPKQYRWHSVGVLAAGLIWHVAAVNRHRHPSTPVPKYLRDIVSWRGGHDPRRDVVMWDTGRS